MLSSRIDDDIALTGEWLQNSVRLPLQHQFSSGLHTYSSLWMLYSDRGPILHHTILKVKNNLLRSKNALGIMYICHFNINLFHLMYFTFGAYTYTYSNLWKPYSDKGPNQYLNIKTQLMLIYLFINCPCYFHQETWMSHATGQIVAFSNKQWHCHLTTGRTQHEHRSLIKMASLLYAQEIIDEIDLTIKKRPSQKQYMHVMFIYKGKRQNSLRKYSFISYETFSVYFLPFRWSNWHLITTQ